MKITENPYIRYTKAPGGFFSGADILETDTNKMFLIGIERINGNKLLLKLKSKDIEHEAHIEVIQETADRIGEKYLDLIEKKSKEKFAGHSYAEILNIDFILEASRIPWTKK